MFILNVLVLLDTLVKGSMFSLFVTNGMKSQTQFFVT